MRFHHSDEMGASPSLLSWTVVPVLVTALLLIQGTLSPLCAHPPSAVSLAYDARTQTLSVAITHSTSFPSKHYISSVDISLNGKPLKKEQYTVQPSSETFTYTFAVPASPGDELSVRSTCSIFGSKEAKTTVPGK